MVDICLDYSRAECRRILNSREIEDVITICDGKSIDGDVYNLLGMSNIPDNIVIENGKVTATNLTIEQRLIEETARREGTLCYGRPDGKVVRISATELLKLRQSGGNNAASVAVCTCSEMESGWNR